MKYLLLILVLLLHTPSLTSQTPLLASVEIRQKPTPPVKKTKAKTKVKKKKSKRKRFKKPNQTQKTTADAKKVWLIILMCQFGTIALLAFGLAGPLFQSIFSGLGFLALAAGIIALIVTIVLLIVLIIHNNKKKKSNNKPTQKTEPIKKSEEVLRAEVSNLSEQKVNRYLVLNERLTSLKIALSTALRNRNEERSRAKRADLNYDIKDLEKEIARTKDQIKNLRQQNEALKED